MTRKRIALVGIAAALALLVAGSAGANIRSHSSRSAVSGSITFDGIWTASSGQKQFADVANDAFFQRWRARLGAGFTWHEIAIEHLGKASWYLFGTRGASPSS